MSNALLNEVWKLKMPPSPKAVLVALADRANRRGQCWPAVADLVERTCLSKRSVLNAIEGLEASEALTVTRAHRKANRYVVTPRRFKAWVQPVHPRLGAVRALSRVQPVHPQGAATAPQPSLNPQREPPLPAEASLGEQVFILGKRLLIEAGSSKKAAGSLLGKLRKEHGDAAVLEAVKAAERQKVSEPASWLIATCRANSKTRASLAIGAQDYEAGWQDEKAAA